MSRVNSETSHLGRYWPPQQIGMIHWTEFERKCQRLNLSTFEQQLESPELKRWVILNMRQYYVPEALLKAWGFHVYVDV